MRVLMTLDGVGGVFTYAVDLISALHAHGVGVTAVSLGRALSREQRAVLREAGPAAYHETGFRLEWEHEPWADLERAGEWLLEVARSEQPEVIHANSYFCGALDWPAPCLVVAHSCVYSWWRSVHGEDPPPEWRRYRECVRGGLAGADAVVAPSAAMLSDLEDAYGSLGERGRVIHNGSALAAARSVAKEPFVLAAGRGWDEAKNLRVLEQVAPRLRAPVLIAGEQPAGAGGSPALRAAGGRPHWLGQLPKAELGALRRRAAVFVAPARYEPFGLAVLEAARDRCALVLGDIASQRELWGDAAVYVPPDDAGALATAVEGLLRAPELAAERGERAQRRAERYSVGAMAAAYASLYALMSRRVEVPA
jgi:glycosyltransferase involved in cell wall biosynthesis